MVRKRDMGRTPLVRVGGVGAAAGGADRTHDRIATVSRRRATLSLPLSDPRHNQRSPEFV